MRLVKQSASILGLAVVLAIGTGCAALDRFSDDGEHMTEYPGEARPQTTEPEKDATKPGIYEKK